VLEDMEIKIGDSPIGQVRYINRDQRQVAITIELHYEPQEEETKELQAGLRKQIRGWHRKALYQHREEVAMLSQEVTEAERNREEKVRITNASSAKDKEKINVDKLKKGQMLLLEFFSPPRVGKIINDVYEDKAQSFDLVSGWDALIRQGRQAVRDVVHKKESLVIGMSPPCTMMSILQNLNPGLMESEVGQQRLQDAIKMLEFCIELALH